MSRFEQEGVDRQQRARTKSYAVYSFNRSCDICCYTGRHIDCRHCVIAAAHDKTMEVLSCSF